MVDMNVSGLKDLTFGCQPCKFTLFVIGRCVAAGAEGYQVAWSVATVCLPKPMTENNFLALFFLVGVWQQ